MFQTLSYLAIVVLISIITNLVNAGKLKSCTFHDLGECPELTKCSQQNYLCECRPNFDFNINYKNDTDYCIPKPILITTESNELTTIIKDVSYEHVHVGSHHLIGGILIPIFIVLIVIGAAYGLKRLEIIRRFREYQMRRRRQPFYEDVMMNQDNDDPPLI